VISTERDYQIAEEAAAEWLDEHGLMLAPGVIRAVIRRVIDAVDDARAKRQQEH